MQLLKADTQVKVVIGPVVAVGDGFTPVVTLSLSTADEAEIMKHDAASVTSISGNTFAAITSMDGYYNLTITAAQLDTEGMLTVGINDDSLCLPVRHDYMVVNANVYDSFYAAATTDYLQTDVTQLGGVTQSATDLKDFADAGYDPATNKVQGVVLVDTTTTNTDMRGTDSALLASSAPTNFGDLSITVTTGQVTVGTNNDKTGYSISGTKTTLDALNDVSTAQVNTEADTALTDFFTTPAAFVDLVWDEVLTGGTHNVANSSGRRLRFLQEAGAYAGAIWIDTINGVAGTTDYENGTDSNPVDTIADANTLATSLGISRFMIAPGSSITLAAAQTGQIFEGSSWTLALGGQNVSNTTFIGADVSGTGTSGSGEVNFDGCHIGTASLGEAHLTACGFEATLTMTAAGDYAFEKCFSEVAGAGTPVFDFVASDGNKNLSVRNYSGGMQINNKDGGTDTDQMSLEGNGQLVVAASSSGAISLRGNFKVTNTGGATITYDDNTQNIADILTDTGTTIPALIGTPVADIASDLLTAAEVNAEVVDVLKTDTVAEMAQQAPPTTPTLEEAVMYLYMALVHKVDIDTTGGTDYKEFTNNAGTVIWKKAVSDDGSTYTEAEGETGP